jgi:uncharacterized lipoprotein YmbA
MKLRSLGFAPAWLGIAIATTGIGCSSTPVRYYTLVSPPEQTSPVAEATLAIDVRVLHIPAQLKRAELMARTGLTEVTLLENERWASPVSDEIKDALRLELQRRQGRLSGLQAASTKLTIDIDVRHFEAEPGKYALLEVSWSADLSGAGQRNGGARAATCTFRADERIQTGYAGMVEGYQREIAALAEAIVAVLASSANGSDVTCQ